jgi:hypothetical protein
MQFIIYIYINIMLVAFPRGIKEERVLRKYRHSPSSSLGRAWLRAIAPSQAARAQQAGRPGAAAHIFV